ncbi:50S ribosomal protein L13, partial [Lactobacillus paracasei]|uniref:50S ribosomal protein L13 n=1 Tax=Lacticaseibacillus paracasei TaxID=1597 RepID=UPI0013A689E8
MKTYSVKAGEIERNWYVVDAGGKVLGRVATEIARVLRGKHKPIYTPHLDTGDFVVVINADKVQLTGNKAEQKSYFKHTGYMGHERFIPFK